MTESSNLPTPAPQEHRVQFQKAVETVKGSRAGKELARVLKVVDDRVRRFVTKKPENAVKMLEIESQLDDPRKADKAVDRLKQAGAQVTSSGEDTVATAFLEDWPSLPYPTMVVKGEAHDVLEAHDDDRDGPDPDANPEPPPQTPVVKSDAHDVVIAPPDTSSQQTDTRLDGKSEAVPITLPEEDRVKEAILDSVVEAAQHAVFRSHGAALVNMSEAQVGQQEVANKLPDYYYHVTVDDIIDRTSRTTDLPANMKGLVVTGYSATLYKDREKERAVEAFIRARVNTRKLALLVFSDSLPNSNLFHDASLPWFNGPFQNDDSVWSIRSGEGGATSLVRHDTKYEILKDPTPREQITWVEKETIQFGK